MQKLKPEKLKTFTYNAMYRYCREQARGKRFVNSITLKLIGRAGQAVRKSLESQGICTKVVRGKAR